MTMVQKVAVVGAGVVGLSTAVQIQQMTLNDVAVTIIADKFTTDTTSHGAAGIFRPTLSKTPGVPLTLLKFVQNAFAILHFSDHCWKHSLLSNDLIVAISR
jgi:glycine/D-amino acid oxidase-like deaminating enzyme